MHKVTWHIKEYNHIRSSFSVSLYNFIKGIYSIKMTGLLLSLSRFSAQTDTSSYEVVMLLYSLMPNPVWIFRSPSQNYQFIKANLPTKGTRPPPAIGYDGFYIEEYKGSQKIRTWYIPGCSNPTLERGLLDMVQGLAAVGESEPHSPRDSVNRFIEVLDRYVHDSQNSQ